MQEIVLQVQLQLLTAIVKLFLKRPTDTQDLVQQVLSLATQVSIVFLYYNIYINIIDMYILTVKLLIGLFTYEENLVPDCLTGCYKIESRTYIIE